MQDDWQAPDIETHKAHGHQQSDKELTLMNIDISLLQPFLQNIGIQSNTLQTIIDLLAFMLPLTALCALAALPFIAVVAQVQAQARQRSFYDKCARQLAALACIMGWLCTLGGAWLAWTRLESAAHYPVIIQGHMLWWLCLTLASLLVSLYFILWKTLRNFPLLHQCIALLGGCLGSIALYATLALMDMEALVDQGLPAPLIAWNIFVPQEQSPLWNIVFFLPALAVGLGAGMGTLWLLLRRHRDDYGRDHYNTMVPWCARWARNAWALLWVILLVFTLLDSYATWLDAGTAFNPQLYIIEALHVLLWCVPFLLWTIVVRSANPLRHKLTLLLAQLIAMGFTVPLGLSLV